MEIGDMGMPPPHKMISLCGKSMVFQISKTRFQLDPNMLQNIGECSRLIRKSGVQGFPGTRPKQFLLGKV